MGLEHGHEAIEKPARTKAFEGTVPFAKERPWQANVRTLLDKAYDDKADKFSSKFGIIIRALEKRNSDITPKLDTTVSLELKEATLILKDSEGKIIGSIDIADAMKQMHRETFEYNCDHCKATSMVIRSYTFRHESYGDLLRRIAATKALEREKADEAARKKALFGPETPPLDPRQKEALDRHRALLLDKFARRDKILKSADSLDEVYSPIDVQIRYADKKQFEDQWRFMTGSDEIDDLFNEDPSDPAHTEAGYRYNPFNPSPKQKFKLSSTKWTKEQVRQLIEKATPDRLDFREVAEEIYTSRFKEMKGDLKKSGVAEVVLKELPEMSEWLVFSKADKLQNAYKKFGDLDKKLSAITNEKDIPADLKELYPHRADVKEIAQLLGDYIAYGQRLTALVGRLKVDNSYKALALREHPMFKKSASGMLPEDRVKDALTKIFLDGVTSPKESLPHWFWGAVEGTGEISFDDLHGNTASIKGGDWATLYQSPETAYKLVFEGAENPRGAVMRLNHFLQLGISASGAVTGDHSPARLLNELGELGAKDALTGEKLHAVGDGNDAKRLYQALAIENIAELAPGATGGALLARIQAERIKLIRVGSVLYQNKGPGEKPKAASIVPTEKQADEIIAKLRETQQFKEEQLTKIKGALLGGVLIVAPLPGSSAKWGGGLSGHIEFENGVSIDVAAAAPQGIETFGVGARVGGEIVSRDTWSFSINAGGGGGFAGATIGGGGRLTGKFDGWTGYVEAGGGLGLGGMAPTAYLGLGIRENPQDTYRKTLTAEQVKLHLDKLKDKNDVYAEVLKNPKDYPELYAVIEKMESVVVSPDGTTAINDASKRAIFDAAYRLFKEGAQGKAMEASASRLLGGGVGVALVGGVPVPYFYLECRLWSAPLVYRIATNPSKVSQVTEAQAEEQIRAAYKGAQKIEKTEITLSNEFVIDPKTKELKLVGASEGIGTINFSHLEKFAEFQDALAKNAKIFVDPEPRILSKPGEIVEGAASGLMELIPREAYGNIRVQVDPALKDDVVLVTKGDRLFISVRNDKEITIKREDITYPFRNRGAVEETYITISANEQVDREVIEEEAAWFLDRAPGNDWVRRQSGEYTADIKGTAKSQENIKTWGEYQEWWKRGHTDRLQFIDSEVYKTAYREFAGALTVTGSAEIDTEKVKKVLQALTSDKAFMTLYKQNTTERYNLPETGKKKKPMKGEVADWGENLDAIIAKIRANGGEDLNAFELNAVMLELLIESFQNLQSIRKKTPEETAKTQNDAFKHYFETFERPMLKAVFEKFYEEEPAETKDAKVAKAVEFMVKANENVDITKPGEKVDKGTFFASFVGTMRITGIRSHVNFSDEASPYGILGKKVLNATSGSEEEREVARFWIEQLSPYNAVLFKELNGALPAPDDEKNYKPFHERVRETLRSRLGLKLAPLIAVTMKPDELKILKPFYDDSAPQAIITDKNVGLFKKFLGVIDRVRTAELRGDREVSLREFGAPNFTVKILKFEVATGIYKKCGNISALLNEEFALVHEKAKVLYYAGMAEGIVGTAVQYARVDKSAIIGLALPGMRETTVKPEPEPETPVTPETPPKTPETPPGATPAQPNPVDAGGVGSRGGTPGGTTGSSPAAGAGTAAGQGGE